MSNPPPKIKQNSKLLFVFFHPPTHPRSHAHVRLCFCRLFWGAEAAQPPFHPSCARARPPPPPPPHKPAAPTPHTPTPTPPPHKKTSCFGADERTRETDARARLAFFFPSFDGRRRRGGGKRGVFLFLPPPPAGAAHHRPPIRPKKTKPPAAIALFFCSSHPRASAHTKKHHLSSFSPPKTRRPAPRSLAPRLPFPDERWQRRGLRGRAPF